MFSLRRAIQEHNLAKIRNILKSHSLTDRDLELATLLALEEGSNIILNELLKYGAEGRRTNPANTQDINGRSLLYLASYNGYVPIIDTLIKYGANPNIKANSDELFIGDTPLIVASRAKDKVIAEKLLRAGADPNIQNDNGETALHIVSDESFTSIVELLLKSGADPNLRTIEGYTPLYRAVHWNNYDIVEMLLQAGADSEIPTDDGITAKMIAIEDKNDALIDLMEEYEQEPIKIPEEE